MQCIIILSVLRINEIIYSYLVNTSVARGVRLICLLVNWVFHNIYLARIMRETICELEAADLAAPLGGVYQLIILIFPTTSIPSRRMGALSVWPRWSYFLIRQSARGGYQPISFLCWWILRLIYSLSGGSRKMSTLLKHSESDAMLLIQVFTCLKSVVL